MKRRRKNELCLNCSEVLDTSSNYCNSCGQENTDNCVSVFELLKDLFNNYLSIDTRLGRSLFPFLFQPGKLTIEFNEGKRVKYMHPLKFYVMLSILYFFIFSYLAMPLIVDLVAIVSEQRISTDKTKDIIASTLGLEGNDELNKQLANSRLFNKEEISIRDTRKILEASGINDLEIEKVLLAIDSVKYQAFALDILADQVDPQVEVLDTNDSTYIIGNSSIEMNDSSMIISSNDINQIPGLSLSQQQQLKETLALSKEKLKAMQLQQEAQRQRDSIVQNIKVPNMDAFKIQQQQIELLEEMKFVDKIDRFFRLIQRKETKPDELLDFLAIKERNYTTLHAAEQTLKIGRNDPSIFIGEIISNSATFIIFMIPLFALCLKGVYLKKITLYIEHLIFTLHLQAFTYFVLILFVFFLALNNPVLSFIAISIILLIHFIYSFIAFRKMYKESRFLTFIKMIFLGFVYTNLLLFFLSIDLFVSFWLF